MAKTASLLAATLAALCLCQSPAQALASRAWVSGHGADAAGCGSPASPCRSLQYVHDNIIAAGGEIDVLDPAGYGAVTISKALSIVNDGVGTAGVQAAFGNAITINAGSGDVIALRGLNIDGLGSGDNGIVFNSGGGLTVVNCVIRHFVSPNLSPGAGTGILIQPSSGTINMLLSNVIASDNYMGFFFSTTSTPSATVVIDRFTATNNAYGIAVKAMSSSSTFALSNSIASSNNIGIYISGAAIAASIDNSSMSGNSEGLHVLNGATVLLGRSVITSNGTGVQNDASPKLFTYGDNRINGNGTDVSSPMNTADKPQ
jgi:hypothetical protein